MITEDESNNSINGIGTLGINEIIHYEYDNVLFVILI